VGMEAAGLLVVAREVAEMEMAGLVDMPVVVDRVVAGLAVPGGRGGVWGGAVMVEVMEAG